MSDDNSHSSDTISNKKGFFSLLLSQLFHGEPKNRDELLALIRDSGPVSYTHLTLPTNREV